MERFVCYPMTLLLFKMAFWTGPVAYAYNLSYLGQGRSGGLTFEASPGKLVRPHLNQQARHGGVLL
jgi:hypothetical protein